MGTTPAGEGRTRPPKPHASNECIADSLRLLAADGTDAGLRQRAARQLIAQLRVLLKSRGFWVRSGTIAQAARLPLWMAEDAVQHVALVASTGNSRFRGQHPKEAVAWCNRVLNNFAVSEWRWRSRFRAWCQKGPGELIGSSLGPEEPRTVFLRLRQRAELHLRKTRRPSAASSLFDAVCCYLDNLAGVPVEHQLERWVTTPSSSDNGDRERARNRLYQYHRRGKAVLIEMRESANVTLRRATPRPNVAVDQ